VSQAIQVWRFVKAAPIASQIAPSQVVDENEDNIWLGHDLILMRLMSSE
jgi:hypothetical protein